MDVFVEQLVKKPSNGKTLALKLLIVFGVIVVSAFCLYLTLIGIVMALLLIFAAIYGGYFLISGLNAEYEYIVTNGEIDIDKIIAQRKRKRLITAKPSKFEAFGKLADAAPVSGITVVEAGGIADEDTEDYFIDFTHDNFGKVRLIFTPTERTLEAIKPFLPRAVRAEYESRNRA